MLNSMHQYKTKSADLSVALLVDNIKFAKRLSEEFRAAGIFPFFYESLEDFWGHIKIDTPDFALIDAKKVREDDVFLKNHPLVKSGKLKCALWVSSPEDLSDSLNFIPDLGFLFSNLDLSTQIKSLVLHGLTLINQDIRLKRSEDKFSNLNERFGDLNESVGSLKSKANANSELKGLLKFFRKNRRLNFIQRLDELFNEWKGIGQFSILKYDSAREQIKCVSSNSHKKITIPNLWPMTVGSTELNGGDVKLAMDLGYKYFASDIVPLRFGKNRDQTDIIVLAGVNGVETSDFDWSTLEIALNGYYLEDSNMEKSSADSTTTYKSLENIITKIENSNQEEVFNLRLAHIDMAPLYDFIFSGTQKSFEFKNFYQTFFSALNEILSTTNGMMTLEGGQFLVLINKADLQKVYNAITEVVTDFSYYSFFKDKKIFIPKNAKPLLAFRPASTKTVLSLFSGKSDHFEIEIDKSTSAIRPKLELNM